MATPIEKFIATMNRRKGFAHVNRYKLILSWRRSALLEIFDNKYNDSESLNLLCDSLSIPGRGILSVDAPLNGFRQSVKYPSGYQNEDITFTFYMTNDAFPRPFFDKWLKLIVTDDYLIKYDADYKVDIEIHQLDKQDNPIYKVKLIRAYPISMQAIQLSASEEGVSKLSVNFTYEDYVPIPIK